TSIRIERRIEIDQIDGLCRHRPEHVEIVTEVKFVLRRACAIFRRLSAVPSLTHDATRTRGRELSSLMSAIDPSLAGPVASTKVQWTTRSEAEWPKPTE